MAGVCGVYAIQNRLSRKCYVGSTTDWNRRRKTHLRELRTGKHHCQYLQRAWNKYGESSFEFIFIHEVDESVIYAAEQAVMDIFHEKYNTGTFAGKAFLGRTHSTEALAKMKAKRAGQVITEETKQKLREANLGKTISSDCRQKISKSLSGLVRPEGFSRKCRRRGYSWNAKEKCWTVRIWHQRRELCHALVDSEDEARAIVAAVREAFDCGRPLPLPESKTKRRDMRKSLSRRPRTYSNGRKGISSGKGYSFQSQIKRWRVRILGVSHGCFRTEEEAQLKVEQIRNGGALSQAVAT